MTQKPYLGTSPSLNPPSGHHYHENALVGDPRAPRNTLFMKKLTFLYVFFALAEDISRCCASHVGTLEWSVDSKYPVPDTRSQNS